MYREKKIKRKGKNSVKVSQDKEVNQHRVCTEEEMTNEQYVPTRSTTEGSFLTEQMGKKYLKLSSLQKDSLQRTPVKEEST